MSAHLRDAALQPAWPAEERRPMVVQRGNHVTLRHVFPKVLVKDPARKEGWPEWAAEPGMLDGDVHFVSEPSQHYPFSENLLPLLSAHLNTPTAPSSPASCGSFWNNDANCLRASLSLRPSHCHPLAVLCPLSTITLCIYLGADPIAIHTDTSGITGQAPNSADGLMCS